MRRILPVIALLVLSSVAAVAQQRLFSAPWPHGTTQVTKPNVLAGTQTLFGVGILHCCNSGSVSAANVTPLPPLVGKAWRIWDTGMTWADINTSAGVFNFSGTQFDDYLAQANAAGADVVYTIGKTPAWASSNSGGTCTAWAAGQCYPPTSYSTLTAFLYQITARARGRIKYWECWNEPDQAGEWQGTTSQLVTFCQNVYTTLKAINPNFVILAPPTSSQSYMAAYLAAGGNAYANLMSVHAYPVQQGSNAVEAEQATLQPGQAYSALSAQYLSGAALWDTESSWENRGNLSTSTLQGAYTAKMYLLALPFGISRRYYYAYDLNTSITGCSGSSQCAQLWSNPGLTPSGISASGTAYLQVQKWLIGANVNAPISRTIANNGITNTTNTGCVNGSLGNGGGGPGHLPTGASSGGDAFTGPSTTGITTTISNCTTTSFDITFSGTSISGSAGNASFAAIGGNAVVAAANQQWTYTQPVTMTAGSTANTTAIGIQVNFQGSGGQSNYGFTPTTSKQTATSWLVAGASTTFVFPQFTIQYASVGAAINITLRFFIPTLDDGTQWTGTYTRPGGYQAEVMWDQNPTGGASITSPAFATQYHDVLGAKTAVTGGTTAVTLTRAPILFENFGVF